MYRNFMCVKQVLLLSTVLSTAFVVDANAQLRIDDGVLDSYTSLPINLQVGSATQASVTATGQLHVAEVCDEAGANCVDISGGMGATSLNALSDAINDGSSVYLGTGSGNTITATRKNVAVGHNSLNALTSGNQNVAVGFEAMKSTTSGGNNTAVGYSALYNNTSTYNAAFGTFNMYQNTSGSHNASFGANALGWNSSGANNSVVGSGSLNFNKTGSGNVALGKQAGYGANNASNVSNNVFVGFEAGHDVRTGANNNIMIGYQAGDAVTTGANNILIGSGVDTSAATASDELNIGNAIKGNLSTGDVWVASLCDETGANCNDLSAGLGGGGGAWSTSGSDVYRGSGNVGIGTSAPTIDLQFGDGTGTEVIYFAGDDGNLNLDIYSSYDGVNSISDQTGMFAYGVRGASDTWGIWHKGTSRTNPQWENYLEVTDQGLVGIGTGAQMGEVSPTASLHVYSAPDALSFKDSFHVGDGTYGLTVGNGTGSGYVPILNGALKDSDDYFGLLADIPAAEDTGTAAMINIFGRRDDSTAIVNRDILDIMNDSTSLMRIKANGHVGIGDTTPEAPLTLQNANSTYSGVWTLSAANMLKVNNLSDDKPAIIGLASASALDSGNAHHRAAISGTHDANSNGALDGRLDFYTRGSDGAAQSPRMTINSAGKVGIGVDNPTGIFEVEHTGTIAATSANVDQAAILLHQGDPATSLAIDNNEIRQFGTSLNIGGDLGLIFHTGDSNNGDTKEVGRFTKGGSFGIGTSTINYPFQVYNAADGGGTAMHLGDGTRGLFLGNATSAGMAPYVRSNIIDDNDHMGILTAVDPASDTGTEPLLRLSARQSDNTDITSRDIFAVYNYATELFNINRWGRIEIKPTGGEAIRLISRSTASDHVYLTFFADAHNQSTRSGYIGYGGVGTSLMTIRNDMSDAVNVLNKLGVKNTSPNAELDVIGSIEYTGTIADVSDRRLKQNIQPLEEKQLDKIAKVNTVSFEMKDKPEVTEYGVIAQELEEVYPLLVNTADDASGTKTVNYVGLIAPLIQSVQELKSRVEYLEAELEKERAK